MSLIHFTKAEVTAALARGVRQCVVIGGRPFREALKSSADESLQVFALDEQAIPDCPATFVETQFCCEGLAAALERSDFDKLKASLFIWLGGAGYRTVDAVLASLAFIASLPRGSGVVFDYDVERTSPASVRQTAMDALASRFQTVGGSVKLLIQPPALAAMLRGLGFQKIVDLAQEEFASAGGHLVSAVV